VGMDGQEPHHVATLDQQCAAARDMAKVVSTYLAELLKEGIGEVVAQELAIAYQSELCEDARDSDGEDDE
jgi:hypothetical protein